MSSDYHHGDLPSTLRASAVGLIAERGPAGFSLREVARRAGVSHTAPAHHFGDAQGLLSSVAIEGFEMLTAAMRVAVKDVADPYERVLACGRAYVSTALENPGHYALMVTHNFTDENDRELMLCGLHAYGVLIETVEYVRDQLNPNLDVDRVATVVWSAVHGLVETSSVLAPMAQSAGTELSEIDELLKTLTHLILSGAKAG